MTYNVFGGTLNLAQLNVARKYTIRLTVVELEVWDRQTDRQTDRSTA